MSQICLQIIQWGNEDSGWEYGQNKTDYDLKALKVVRLIMVQYNVLFL